MRIMFAIAALTALTACNDDATVDATATVTDGVTCISTHECVNEVCTCTTDGKDGDSCSGDSACVDECEVCDT